MQKILFLPIKIQDRNLAEMGVEGADMEDRILRVRADLIENYYPNIGNLTDEPIATLTTVSGDGYSVYMDCEELDALLAKAGIECLR